MYKCDMCESETRSPRSYFHYLICIFCWQIYNGG